MKSSTTYSDPPWLSITTWRYILSGTSCMIAGASKSLWPDDSSAIFRFQMLTSH